MKRLFLILILPLALLFAAPLYATTYYVDNCVTVGNNSNNGTSTSTPWLTVSKVNGSSFSAGDSILFEKTCTWHEKLTPPSAGSSGNPITFGAYGSGALPTIDGADALSGWTNTSGNVWQVAWTQASNQVIRNGVRAVKEASQGALTANYEWYANGTNLFIYTTTNPTSDSSAWEAGDETRYNTVQVNNLNYVTVDSLNIINGDETGGAACFASNASTQTIVGLTLSNSTITNCYQYGIQLYNGSYGYNGVMFTNDTISYSAIAGGGYGQVLIGGALSATNQVQNVTITNMNSSYAGIHGAAGVAAVASKGLFLDDCVTCTISGFTLNYNGDSGGNVQNSSNGVTYSNGQACYNGQTGFSGGDNNGLEIGDIGNGSSNVTITGSLMCNNEASAIAIASTNTNQVSSNITISYNTLSGSVRSDGNGQGLQVGGGMTGMVVEYNLIYGNADYGYSHTAGTSGSPTVLMYNNVIYGNGTGGNNTENVYVNGNTLTFKNNIVAQATGQEMVLAATFSVTSDYNDFYHFSGGNFMTYQGTATTLAGWRTDTSGDSHSIGTSPSFSNAGGNVFTLLPGSGAAGTGVNLGVPYQTSLLQTSAWPSGVLLGGQAVAWNMGAYLTNSAGEIIGGSLK